MKQKRECESILNRLRFEADAICLPYFSQLERRSPNSNIGFFEKKQQEACENSLEKLLEQIEDCSKVTTL